MAAVNSSNLTYVLDQTTPGWRKSSLDMMSDIINISPTDYVFFSHTDNVSTNNVTTTWQLRRLPARSFSGYTRQEGLDFVASTNFQGLYQPTRVTNTAHILWLGVEVSDTNQAESHYGAANLFKDQVDYNMEIWKGAAENALIRSTESTGATNGARFMDGLLASITTNASNNAQSTLSETKYIDLLRMVWSKGPKARDVLVNASLQMVIDRFNANGGTKQVMVTDEGITNMVTYYRSPFGVVRNHLTRDLEDGDGTAEIVALDFRTFHKAWLRRFQMVPLPKTSDGTRGVLIGELTLKYDDEQAAAKYTGLDTSA